MVLAIEKERHLGDKAFVFMLARRLFLAFILFGIAVILQEIMPSLLQGSVAGNIVQDSFRGMTPIATASFVQYAINGVYLLSYLVLAAGFIITILEYFNYTYMVQEFDLLVKHGILNKQEISIPYRQMQNVNVQRGILYQLLGFSRVVIESAGHEEHGMAHSEIMLDPMDSTTASELREFLERRIGVQVVENEKVVDREMKNL